LPLIDIVVKLLHTILDEWKAFAYAYENYWNSRTKIIEFKTSDLPIIQQLYTNQKVTKFSDTDKIIYDEYFATMMDWVMKTLIK